MRITTQGNRKMLILNVEQFFYKGSTAHGLTKGHL